MTHTSVLLMKPGFCLRTDLLFFTHLLMMLLLFDLIHCSTFLWVLLIHSVSVQDIFFHAVLPDLCPCSSSSLTFNNG